MRRTLLAMAATLVVGVGVGRADVVYNNLRSTNTTDFSFGTSEAYAQKFNAGAGGQIDNIKLNLHATGTTPAWAGNFNIQIWTGVANSAAGSLFLDFYQGNQANIGTLGGVPLTYSYNMGGSNTALVASQDYFLVVTRTPSTNGGRLNWGSGPNSTGASGNVFRRFDGDSNWTNLSFPGSAGFGAEIVTVPEPGTMLLGGIAACGGAGAWWRRRRKAVQVAAETEATA